MKILDKKVSSNVNLFSINEWFYNILGAILYSRILRILRMSNTTHITHGSIYGIMYANSLNLKNWGREGGD